MVLPMDDGLSYYFHKKFSKINRLCVYHSGRSKHLGVFLLLPIIALLSGLRWTRSSTALPEQNIPSTHLFGVTRIAFGPSGDRIASGGFKGDVALWEVPAGRAINQFKWHADSVRGLVWVGSDHLISAAEEGTIVIADLNQGGIEAKVQTETGLTSLAYISQAKIIVAGFESGAIRAFSYPQLKSLKQIKLGSEIVSLIADHAGTKFAVSTDDERVLLMDGALVELRELERPSRSALELRFSPNDEELVAGAWYNVFYWDLESGRIRTQETEHWGAVTSLDFHPDGNRLITLGRHTDANLRLVDTDNGDVIRRLQGHRLCGAAVRFSPNGRYVASGSDDESIRFYDLSKPYRPQRVGDNW